MRTTQESTWRAGRFWWDATTAMNSHVYPLRAVIFDLDALADIECEGHRVAFNAAFAAHGLDVQWSVSRYRKLLALSDERQRVSAELRKRGIATECDVLTELLADEIYATKTMMFDELISDADLAPRPGLVDLVLDAFAAGVWVGVVTNGPRRWTEPVIRHLVGDGLVETVVTADDVKMPMPDREAHQNVLWELGIPAENALAISGSASGLRAATTTGLPTIVITGDGAPTIPAAVAVRSGYDGNEPLRITDCQRMHGHWWAARQRSAA
ncbi:HAD hydrolase-like protein [Mycobacterium sp. URHB0021]